MPDVSALPGVRFVNRIVSCLFLFALDILKLLALLAVLPNTCSLLE